MTTTIALTGIAVHAHHGVFGFEREQGQEFLVDVTCTLAHPATDDLSATLDYGALAQRVHDLVAADPVDLIETVAERVARDVARLPGVRRVVATVHKPSAPMPVSVRDVSVTVEADVTRVVLSMGSNVGDRAAHLQQGIAAVSRFPGTRVVAVSPVYETRAVGPAQPDFLNLVVIADTALKSLELLRFTQRAEGAAGRPPDHSPGPRPLDIDLITAGDETTDSDRLTLPHPRAHEREFVLRPWLDVEPGATLPGRGRVAGLLAALPDQDVRRTPYEVRHG